MSRSIPALRFVCAVALALLLTSQVGAAHPGDAPAAASGPTEIILRVQTPAYTLDSGRLARRGGRRPRRTRCAGAACVGCSGGAAGRRGVDPERRPGNGD